MKAIASADAASWLSAGAAVALVLGGFIAFLWRARRPIGRFFVRMVSPFTAVERVNRRLDDVLKELRPNGGDSLRDAINRLETRQATFDGLMRATWDRDMRPLFQADDAGHYTYVNHAFLSLTGRAFSDVMGAGWINVVHPDDRNRVRQLWHQAVAEKRGFEEEFKILDQSGVTHSIICYAYPTLTKGVITGYIGHFEYLWTDEDGARTPLHRRVSV